MKEALKVAFSVWNAAVYEAANGEASFLQMLRESMASRPELAAPMEQMISRKRNLFGDDHRVVGQFKLTRKAGELYLRAEARDPKPSN